jgi:two-component system, cell cycle sensor histidine kinase and response regulator CckA
MIEGSNRTNRTFAWLRSKNVRGKQMVRVIVTVVVTLALLALSQYEFHADLRLDQIVFVALGWVLAVVIDRSQAEKVVAQAPLARSQELLQQSQKMEAVGRLAGGVAHDFNNLLAVITGYSDLLLESLASSGPDHRKVEQIKQAANSAASLTRQLLMFSRQQVVQPVILDINQTVGNIEKMLRRLIKENIEFTVVLDRYLDRVKADPGQIEQIVLNLVVNARDAMPNGGKLRIQTTNAHLEKDSPQAGAGGPRGHFILLEVTDTGTGMDQQTQARIFEPFFTTKAVGKGTGLGLATVYGIVKQSNGHIEVQSTLGHGSSFKIYLPAAEQTEADHESRNNSAETAFSGEIVLVVEDAKPLRGLICEALSASGCTVLSARDGREASRIVNERKGAIDLLLTDVIMPGISGPALAKQVRSLRPQTKILYMSGYSGEFLPDMLTPGVSFIQKPFTLADLARKIGKMLADKPKETSASAAALSQPTAVARKAASGAPEVLHLR